MTTGTRTIQISAFFTMIPDFSGLRSPLTPPPPLSRPAPPSSAFICGQNPLLSGHFYIHFKDFTFSRTSESDEPHAMLFIRPTTASLHRAPPAFPTFRQRFLVFRTNIFRWLSHSSFRHLRLFHVFAVNSVAEWPNDDRRQTIVTAGFAEERRERMRRRNESTQTRFHALIRHPSGTPFSLRSRRFKLSYLGRFFNDSSFFEPPISLLSPLPSLLARPTPPSFQFCAPGPFREGEKYPISERSRKISIPLKEERIPRRLTLLCDLSTIERE